MPLLSGRFSSIVQCPAAQLKQENYLALLSFIPSLLVYLEPGPFEDSPLIQSFLSAYLRFFEVFLIVLLSYTNN